MQETFITDRIAPRKPGQTQKQNTPEWKEQTKISETEPMGKACHPATVSHTNPLNIYDI